MKALDVMGFAGGFAVGVDQAGFDVIAKREPSKFKSFGVAQHLYNMPWLEAQVSDPRDWDLPSERVEYVFGNPPCSGFSALSFANTKIHGATVGPLADINECMTWFVEYAARVKPRIMVMESVGIAFKNGREWMETRWELLKKNSGLPYKLTHVTMNAALVGGDVIRPRYFMVAHLDDFGVGLEFVEPRSAWEVLKDLPAEEDQFDLDWGHSTFQANGPRRMAKTMKWLREMGREWRPGTYMAQNVQDLEPPEWWLRPDGKTSPRNPNPDLPVYSHWFSTDPFATFRWRPEKPYGVVVAAVLDRAVHPVHDRTLTFREAARFMSLPDDWSLRPLVETNSGAELGKGIPSASGKWISHWAKMSLEGTPGEFAGEPTENPDVRVIDLMNAKKVERVRKEQPKGSFYTEGFSDPDPAIWLIDRKQRPSSWWQAEEPRVAARFSPMREDRSTKAPVSTHVETATIVERRTRRAPQALDRPVVSGKIERIDPDTVQRFLDDHALSREEAARALGVSGSRVHEFTHRNRPGSWLNAARWPEVQAKLLAARG